MCNPWENLKWNVLRNSKQDYALLNLFASYRSYQLCMIVTNPLDLRDILLLDETHCIKKEQDIFLPINLKEFFNQLHLNRTIQRSRVMGVPILEQKSHTLREMDLSKWTCAFHGKWNRVFWKVKDLSDNATEAFIKLGDLLKGLKEYDFETLHSYSFAIWQC